MNEEKLNKLLDGFVEFTKTDEYQSQHYDQKMIAEGIDKVEFMMVNQTDGARDTTESVKEFIENEGYEFPVYYDVNNEAYTVYGATSIPAGQSPVIR